MPPDRPSRNQAAGFPALALAAFTLAGCGPDLSRPANDQISMARANLQQAEQEDASAHAPAELNNARKKLQRAQSAANEEEFAEALRWAEQASIDAELAAAKARSAKSRAAADAIRESIDALERELERAQRDPA